MAIGASGRIPLKAVCPTSIPADNKPVFPANACEVTLPTVSKRLGGLSGRYTAFVPEEKLSVSALLSPLARLSSCPFG